MSASRWDPKTLVFPPVESSDVPSVNPKPLAPLNTPPTVCPSTRPAPPSPPRKSLIEEWYTLSTHLVPAAYPRTTPFVSVPPLPQWSPDKAEFKASVEKTVDALIGAKEALWAGKLDDAPRNKKLMWHCVNRYVRKRGVGKGVTLFLAHANGFPKEVNVRSHCSSRTRANHASLCVLQSWEPALKELLVRHGESKADYAIDEIWAWEAVNHGDSCLVNRDNLGGLCS